MCVDCEYSIRIILHCNFLVMIPVVMHTDCYPLYVLDGQVLIHREDNTRVSVLVYNLIYIRPINNCPN